MGDYIPKDQMWLFGMSLNIFGSVMVNFGTNLMKSAHNLFEETEANELEIEEKMGDKLLNKKPKSMFNSKNIWALGLTIFCVGCLVNFASFAFAAQSLLAALGTVQFVSNVFFAKFVLGEVLTVRIVVATMIIVGGLLMAILFSNHASESYTSQDLMDLYTPGYFLFLVVLVVFLIIMHSVYLVYTRNEEAGTPLQGKGCSFAPHNCRPSDLYAHLPRLDELLFPPSFLNYHARRICSCFPISISYLYYPSQASMQIVH